MANSNAPRGLVPIQTRLGTIIPVAPMKVSSTLTADIGVGTPLVELSTGFVTPMTATTAANQKFVGVAMQYRAGSSGKTEDILVANDPDQVFLIQSAFTTNSQAIVGASCRIYLPAGVNTTTQLSKAAAYTLSTTASAPLRILGKIPRDGNDWGTYVDLLVKPIPGLHQRGAVAAV